MPPLRKKGRGGGGGKTEAPLPGEIPGTSPSISASVAKKERERRSTPTTRASSSAQGLEHIGVYVTRSFQKDRGEKKLLESSRTSLHLASGTFQRSLKPRKAEASSTDSTPRVVVGPSGKREDRDKRASISSAHRASSALRAGREELQQPSQQSIGRTSRVDSGEQKMLYRRPSKSIGVDDKLIRKVAGARDERSVDYSSRYNSIYPGITSSTASIKAARNSQTSIASSPRSGIPQRLERVRGDTDVKSNPLMSSPASPALKRSSPRPHSGNITVSTTTSPVVTLPVKSSCKCGGFRSSESASSVAGTLLDDKRRGFSPLSGSKGIGAGTPGRLERKERTSRDLLETKSHESPVAAAGQFQVSGSSGGRSSTPNLLQGRLALLEGRVTQIAAELKATKDMLDSNNPACSKAVLTDIQLKISGIEKAINYRLAKECGLLDQLEADHVKGTYIQANDVAIAISGELSYNNSSERTRKSSPCRKKTTSSEIVPHGHGVVYGKVSRTMHDSKALAKSSAILPDGISSAAPRQLPRASALPGMDANARERYRSRHHAGVFPYADHSVYAEEFGGSAPSTQVKPAMDQIEYEEMLYPHQKLLRNKPAVQQQLLENRAALHQKLLENSVLLRSKLAALQERDGVKCEATLTGEEPAEFLSDLRQQQHAPRSQVERESHRRIAGNGGCGSSGGAALHAESSGPFELPDNDGVFASQCMKDRRRSSIDGRRLSLSRRSFSGMPTEITSELILQSLDKSSPGGRAERRRSSEKRKSISRNDGCSPDSPVVTTRQIVMLEPAKHGSGPIHTAVFEDRRKPGVDDKECAEMPYASAERRKNFVLAMSEKAYGDENDPRPAPHGEDPAVDLACDESLSSDGSNEEGLDDPGPGHDDEEQSYLGEFEDNVPTERLHQIGEKVATAGWFISEGDGILLAHDDASCSYFDAANMEGKSKFKRPPNLPAATWRDCWLIRAPGSDGALNKYVVATSGGSSESAFCSWNFYDRRNTALHFQSSGQASPGSYSSRSSGSSSPEHLRSGSRNGAQKSGFSWYVDCENGLSVKGRGQNGLLSTPALSGCSILPDKDTIGALQRWYRPCSPLLASAATRRKSITLYDVRDGDLVMKWDVAKRIKGMQFSSPIQWRNKGKLVVAEEHQISVWDVNSITPQCAHNFSVHGHRIQALHVRNSDAESLTGVRQRSSSRDQISGDGIVCTEEAVHILDFRTPTGVALKIPTFGGDISSVSASGELIFAGVSSSRPADSNLNGSSDGSRVVQLRVNEWSIKQAKPMSTYKIPDPSGHCGTQHPICQVWGTSDTVFGVSGNGLFMFDSVKGCQTGNDGGCLRESLGTDGLVDPTFDHSDNSILLISRDRPASWCHWP